MSDNNTLSRRNLFKGAGLGLIAGVAGSALLRQEKVCLDESLPADSPESRLALRELTTTLNDYDQDYIERGFTPPDDRDFAEGERYLTHLFRVGAELFMEGSDDHPELVKIVTPTMKLMGDNADAYYFHSQIRGDRRYFIKGKRSGEVYISVTIHTGDETGGWATGVAAAINDRDIAFNEDGSFELLIGPDVSGPNSIKTTADSVSVITRHYYMNETYAAADPSIEPHIYIQNETPQPPPAAPTDQSIAKKIRALNRFIRANSIDRPLMNPLTTPDWFSLIPNKLGPPQKWNPDDKAGGWGAVDNAYSAGMFRLEPGQALIIEGIMPECVFSNILLWNRYLQTFDYRYRQVSLNKKQMRVNTGEAFRIVVAHQDPGVDNWLDTEGRNNGIIYWRFLLPEGELLPMQTQLVAFDDIKVS